MHFQVSLKRLSALCGLAILGACTTAGNRTSIEVAYYDVKGNSFEELDRSISLHGPNVEGVGKAIAATGIRMDPKVSTRMRNGKCVVSSARVKVRANVTLPRRLTSRPGDREVNRAFENLQDYAKLHEAVHVAIADQIALETEQLIRGLPPKNTCDELREDIARVFNAKMVEHRKEQLDFDRRENQRIAELVSGTT